MVDKQQAWSDEVQAITSDYIGDDDDLGELMLDNCERYWDHAYDQGLTPQQALDQLIDRLQATNALDHYKHSKAVHEANSWWQFKMSELLRGLSRIKESDEVGRERLEIEIERLTQEILQRYRDVKA